MLIFKDCSYSKNLFFHCSNFYIIPPLKEAVVIPGIQKLSLIDGDYPGDSGEGWNTPRHRSAPRVNPPFFHVVESTKYA